MAKKKFLLEQLSWPEAKQAFDQGKVVVIPTGSTEQHGPHMPLGTDFLAAHEIAMRLGERADVIVTPVIPVGFAKYHNTFPGTFSVHEETLTRVYTELCEDLVRYGAKRILFVNGHGGNANAIRQCGDAMRRKNVLVAAAVYWEIVQTVNPEWLPIGHGDYIETSLVLAMDEELARMDIARIPDNKNLSETIGLDTPHRATFKGGSVFVNLLTADISDSGDMLEYGLTGASDYGIPPTVATKEMGEEIFEGIANYLADFVKEFKKIDITPVEDIAPVGR